MLKPIMRDIDPTWLIDNEMFPGKMAVRLQLEDHIYYVIVDFEEIVEAVKWRKENEPEVKDWKHNIPLKHKSYWMIETAEGEEIKIHKIPVLELVLFAAICTAGEDTLEIED